jgi:flavin-dependent dehydrogenase
MKQLPSHDVAVIGGGPAGAAAATQLAKTGLKVAVLEKEKFPRFSIGESLLPHGNELLHEIGVWEKLEQAGFLRKYGAEFCTGDKTRLRRFWFGQNLGPSCEYSYQVERSSFDDLLLKNAREHGCEVFEETKVTSLENPNTELMTLRCEGVRGQTDITCRWVVDASGRSAFSGKRIGLNRRPTQNDRRMAIYGHFEGVFRNSGKAAGHITIARIPGGWFWLIPLAGNRTSVGLVLPAEKIRAAEVRSLDAIFQEAVLSAPEVRDRMSAATPLSALQVTADYSWKHSSFASRRVILTGDAAGFVDPIFSSGVMLALKSGINAAGLIAKAEKSRRHLTPWERYTYTRQMTGWMNRYAGLIKAFYDRAGFEVFMNPMPFMKIPNSIARLVGGDAEPHFLDRIRLEMFFLICRTQRMTSIAPSIPSLR